MKISTTITNCKKNAMRFFSIAFLSFIGLISNAQNKVTGVAVSSTQTGTLTYGTSANVTYTVTLNTDGGAGDGLADLSLNWSAATPSGTTYNFTPNSPVTLPDGTTSTNVTLTITSANATDAGTYDFTISASNNPTVAGDPQTSGTASFVVDQAPITIAANDGSKVYGTVFPTGAASTAFTSSGLQNGETIGSITISSTGAAATAAVGTYPIAGSAATGGTFDAANYTITYTDGTLTVIKANLTIAANDGSKVYGTVFPTGAGSAAFTSSGLQNGETIGSITISSTGAAATAAVGTYPIAGSAATGGTFDAANYTITYTDGTLTVIKANLTIAANDGSKVYGTVFPTGAGSAAFTSSGLQNGETIGSITISSTGAAATAAVGTYPIAGSAATGGTFDAANYTITYTDGTLTVTKANLTITANDGSKVYGTLYPTGAGSTAFTPTGLQNGETVGSITISSTGAPANAAVGTYPIIPTAAAGGTFNAANYTITYTNGTLTVTSATLTVTASAQSKVYGTTAPTSGTLGTNFTVTGLQGSDAVSGATLGYSGAPAGNLATAAVGSYTITPSGVTFSSGSASNYTIVYNTGTLTVTKAALTITANNGSKVYGTLYPTGAGSTAFTPTGLQNGETVGSITISSTGAPANAAVGTYPIIPTAAAGGTFNAANYTITYTNGTLTVTSATLTVTASAQSKVYGTTAPTSGTLGTNFTVTGLQGSDAVSGATLGYSGAPAGNLATAAVGSYTITPSGVTFSSGSASNYTIVYNTGTLTVTKAALTITANNGSKVYGTLYPTGAGSTAFTPTGLQNGETVGSITISSTGAPANAAVGTYPIMPTAAAGGTFNAANYTITYTNGTLTVTSATLTVTASAQSKVYGTTAPTSGTLGTNFTVTGLQGSDAVSGATLGYSGAPAGNLATAAVGSYTITPSGVTFSSGSASNYTIVYNTGTLTVTKAALTITANNGSKVYGTLYPTGAGSTAFTPTGLQNGETVGSITISSTGAPANAAVGTYPIIPTAAAGGTFNAANYTITYTNGTLTVTSATLTVTASAQSKVYGTTAPTSGTLGTNFTVTGLQGSDAVSGATLGYSGAPAGNLATAAVGSYTITPSGVTFSSGSASNYTIVYNTGTLTVTKAALTITANNGSKVYGTLYPTGAGSTAFTPTGLQNGETVGSITISSTGAPANAAVGTYPIIPTAAAGGTFNAANYTITYTNGTLTVTKAALTITANNGSKVYGTLYPTGAGSTAFTPTGLQNGETVGSITISSTGAPANAAVGTYPIIPTAATGGTFNAANYTITYINGTLTVTQATLTITANNGTKPYGTVYTTGAGSSAFTSAGLQNGETIGSITIASTGAPAAAALGTYPIIPSAVTGGTFNAANYTITYTNGTLTVIMATPSIVVTSNNNPSCFGSSITFTATITSSPNVTGSVQFFDGATSLGTVAVSGNVATYSTSTLTATSHSITAKYLGDVNFVAVTSAVLTQVVNNPPALTGYALCQGLSVPAGQGLTSTASCAASAPGTSVKLPGTTANASTGISWVNTANISAADGVYSTVTVSGFGDSKYITGSNYGFSIPANATINGVVVSMNRYATGANLADEDLYLIVSGGLAGTDHSTGALLPNGTPAVASYGTATDTWGNALTPALINASNFGVAYSVIDNVNGSRTANLDYIQVTVYYTIPGSLNWYTAVSGGTLIGNGTPFNPVGATGSGLANTNTPGTYQFFAECTSTQPGCRSEADFVINPTPTITGTTTICAGSTTQLMATTTPAATNPWTSSAPGVASVNNTGLVTATATGGTTTITYTNSNGCQATALITVRPTPTATITTSATQACQNATAPTITISNPQAFPVTVTYTINGVTQPTINIAANGTATATSQGTATLTSYTYQLVSIVYQTTPTCGNGLSGSVTYTVNPLPTVTGTTPNSRCGTGTVTIGATASAGATIDWYANATGGAVLAGGTGTTSYTTPSISTTTTYYAQARNTTTGCISATRTAVVATVNPNPTVFNVTGGGTYCTGGAGLPVGLSGSQTGVNYTLTPGAIVVAGTGSAISFGNQTASGTYTVSASNTTTGCTSAMSGSATIVIDAPVITSVSASSYPNLCFGNPDTLKALPNGSSILTSENFEGTSTFAVTYTNNIKGIWALRSSPYTYTGTGTTFNDGSNFMVAVSDSAGFATTTNTFLTSPAVNTTGYAGLTLTFNMYYRASGDDVFLDVSTDGGTTWTSSVVDYSTTQGTPTSFAPETVNLNTYVNVSSFRFRLHYNSNFGYFVAVDNFVLTGSNPNKYSWTSTAGGGLPGGAATPSTANSTVIAMPTATGSITYTATLLDGVGCTAPTKSLTVNVLASPTITTQPVDKEGCIGDTITLSAVATGTSQTYQWYKNGVALTDGAHYSGSATTALTINSLVGTDQDSYYLVVTNSNSCAVVSNTVNLVVSQAIIITSQPSNQTVCAGTTVTFSVTATGGTFAYQWRKGNTNLADGGNISGSSTATLTLTNVTSADASTDYNVVITGTCVSPVISNYVSLTVNNAAVTPTTQASFILFPTVNPTSATVSFNPSPDATNYLIIVKSTAGAPANPVDGTSYTAGSGTLATGRVEYVGTNTFVTSNGLSPNTNYCYYVYAFNKGVCGTTTRYKTPPLNGCVTTGTYNSCGTPIAALYWAGKSSIIAGGPTTGTNFNAAANWSTSSSSYVPSPSVPNGCNDVFIQLNNANASTSVIITLAQDDSVNNLTYTITGGGNPLAILSTQGHTLVVNGDAVIDVVANNGDIYIGEYSAAPVKGVVDFKANVSLGPSNTGGEAYFLGNDSSTIIFRGDLVLGRIAAIAVPGGSSITPGTALFDGPGLQQVTWNNNQYYANFRNIVIGRDNNPIVRHVTGTFVPDNILNNLTINGSSVVDLAQSQWNRISVGGTFKMNGTSRLILGNNKSVADGGQGGVYMGGSNFPGGFATMTFSPTSTVEYNGADNITQTVYAVPTYGNLELSNSNNLNTANKISTATVTVSDSLLIDSLATFTPGTNDNIAVNGKAFVKGGGTLILGTTQFVNGTGAFNMNSNGNLSLANLNGISAAPTATGSVVTTTRNFGTAANFTYNGTGAQITGNGLPYLMGNLTIQNTLGITMPTTSRNYTVINTLTQTSGPLVINGDTITINKLVRSSGTFTGSDSANIGITSSQNIPLFFTGNAGVLKDLYLTANATANTPTSQKLTIVGGAKPGSIAVASGATLTLGDTVTLKSNYFGTASVKQSYGTISGSKIIVERFIPPLRAWRFLTSPTNTTQTINKAWMEGSPPNATITTHNNPKPGYGTEITYDNLTAHGYDYNTTYNPSIKYWDSAANAWNTPPNTYIALRSHDAYCLFVRGSRAVDLSLAENAPPDSTILRAFGSLNQTNGNPITRNITGVAAGGGVFVGNPYASSINITTLIDIAQGRISGINSKQFSVWDPKRSGAGTSNVGGFVDYSNGVIAPNGSPSFPTAASATVIQSGEGFFLPLSTGNTTASVQFQETDKSAVLPQAPIFGRQIQTPTPASIYSNLMVPTAKGLFLVDGVASGFGANYNAGIDKMDFQKKPNFDENMMLVRNDNFLSIEFRPIPVLTDTLFYKLYLRQQPYVLQIFSQNMSSIPGQAWLVDKYLNTQTAVNLGDTTLYSFTPNTDTNSYRNRFMLVFKRTFKATPIATTLSSGGAAATTLNGTISIYPNPVKTGDKVSISFTGVSKGRYEITITDLEGKALTSETIDHAGGNFNYQLQLDSRWTTGNYLVRIRGEDGKSTTVKLIFGK